MSTPSGINYIFVLTQLSTLGRWGRVPPEHETDTDTYKVRQLTADDG